MSELRIYPDSGSERHQRFVDAAEIAAQLAEIGVRFERWTADKPLTPQAGQEEVIAAYRADIDRLMKDNGFRSVDVISVSPDHPDRKALRDKFLSEHVHTEFEVRFFVDGRGLFFLHIDDWVYAVLCEKGDLISVPSGVRHWFDLGEHPDVKAIRLFSEQSGWVAHYTNDDIAQRFPLLERFLAEREMGPV
ncbi:MAG: cupin [Halothiobacillaceae bacterium]|nr:cupin [Halothiobacillaceae bacterium]